MATRKSKPSERGTEPNAQLRPAIKKKAEAVEKLAGEIKGSKVVALIDLKSLPDRILQKAKKQLRGSARFVMAKNTVLLRALERSGKGEKLSSLIKNPSMLVLTGMTPYSLFGFFRQNKAKVAAKPGQIAPFDLIVHEGETDLPPGPALSELKTAGINAQVKAGKIVVAKDSTVAKSGAKISQLAAKALQKLNVLPFETGVSMVAATEGNDFYMAEVLNIDEAMLSTDLKSALSDAMNMSINASYPTDANITILLSSAYRQADSLAKNGGLYSELSLGSLLAQAVLQANAIPEPAGVAAVPAGGDAAGGKTPPEENKGS